MDLDAPLDPRFGRCAYFVFVDTDTMNYEAQPNPGVAAAGGAGIQAAQLVAANGAQAVIAGNFGPNAFQALSAGGIKIYAAAGMTVRQAVEKLKNGELQEVSGSTVPLKFGMGQQPGTGPAQGAPPQGGFTHGMGGGRGMGRGMGGGMGRGGGRGRGRGGW